MPTDPSVRGDASAVDSRTLKNMTLLIALVSLPIIVGFCWAAYLVPAYLEMNQDSINIQLTDDQEFFLMAYSYSGLIGLSLLSCFFFWVIFNNKWVPKWIKVCMNILIVGATICCIVLTVVFLPQSPTSVVLTAEKGTGRIEIFEGLIYQSTGFDNTECYIEKTDDGDKTMLKCGNMTLIPQFVKERKHLSQENNTLSLLHPDTAKDIFKLFNQKKVNIYLAQSEKFQEKIEAATCLECHYEDSNRCRNIIAATGKKACTSTCTRIPRTSRPLTTEELDLFLDMGRDIHNRTTDTTWKDNTAKTKTKSVDLLCQAPNYFFETEGTGECKSSGAKDCREVRLKCLGNDMWNLDRNLCRSCKTDDECVRIKKGNKCRKGVCVKEMLLVGLSQEEAPVWEMSLFDPTSNKTEMCEIPPVRKNDEKVTVTRMNFIENGLYAFGVNGDPFKLDGMTWTSRKSMKLPRVDAAAIVLKDGRWFVSGGESTKPPKDAVRSSEYSTNSGEKQ